LLKVDLIGFDKYIARLKAAPKQLQAEIAEEIKVSSLMFRDGAKRDLANQGGDTGSLLNSITAKQLGIVEWEVTEEKFYAPFIEFGTKGKYRPYPGTEEFAAQFKGYKRGTFPEFIEAIKKWVKRKGIGATYSVKTRKKNRQTKDDLDRIAFLIAMSILKKGIEPKPHFFKQVVPVKQHIEKQFKRILDGL